ncbi:MAG: hypothetical protein LBK54_06770 [Propionibacteriaceae bacterium]|jgi:hypothetical protein|nr:hypothetical protein [Propionibacteriaceae bacterium]
MALTLPEVRSLAQPAGPYAGSFDGNHVFEPERLGDPGAAWVLVRPDGTVLRRSIIDLMISVPGFAVWKRSSPLDPLDRLARVARTTVQSVAEPPG